MFDEIDKSRTGGGIRTELGLRLVCSECGELLECEADKKTRFEFNSAMKAEAVMAIRPCPRCLGEARRPLELLREALNEAKEA